jgi:ribosomal protein S18 acetylase RimI-like enzyme
VNTTTTYRRLDPAEARAATTALKTVYAAVFSQPPYNEGPKMADDFISWVHDESNRAGFAMVVAYADEQPIGFAYGYTMPAGEWFRNTDQPAPPQAQKSDKFAVMEWAVLPSRRGEGIGRILMDLLLDARPENWAVLTVDPASDARNIYERAGWRQVASTKPSRTWPAMNVMALDLGPRETAGPVK